MKSEYISMGQGRFIVKKDKSIAREKMKAQIDGLWKKENAEGCIVVFAPVVDDKLFQRFVTTLQWNFKHATKERNFTYTVLIIIAIKVSVIFRFNNVLLR